jgi:quinol monooxygenase YgiN
MNYVLINKMTTKPNARQQVIDIMIEAGKLFSDNPSCLLYIVSASKDDANLIWVQDIWKNQTDHELAMKSEEMSDYVKQAMPLLEGMPEQFEVEPKGGKSDLI